MTTNDTYDLLSLLATPSYTLAYALPLFLVSLVLTLAGCFLTLDRTRAFPPTQQSQPSPSRHRSVLSRLYPLYLGGGLGGLCVGYAFGVHFSTFLSVVLPSVTSASPLGHKAFLAVWIISALSCFALGGKWKYAALVFIGISGYCTLALAISVIVHPPLLSRIVLASVFTPLGTILTLLPFPRCARIALRIGASSVGSFGTTLSIGLFCRNPAWGNVWDRFWMHDGLTWGSSAERGLSAAFCFLFLAGVVSDYYLHLKIGENPDEKWDRYLANYAAELPNDSRRAGSYAPLIPFWGRILGKHDPFAPIVPHDKQEHDIGFPHDADIKFPVQTSATRISLAEKDITGHDTVELSDIPHSKLRFALLRKKDSRNTAKHIQRGPRHTIKFRPHELDSSDSEEEEGAQGSAMNAPAPSRTDSSTTLVDSHGDLSSPLQPPKQPWHSQPGVTPEYSDGEDIASVGRLSRADLWPPEFIQRNSTRKALPHNEKGLFAVTDNTLHSSPRSPPVSPTVTQAVSSVPATPSLIRAVERIQLAQTHNAIVPTQSTPASSSSPPPTSSPLSWDRERRRKSWDAFWDDVKAKAHY